MYSSTCPSSTFSASCKTRPDHTLRVSRPPISFPASPPLSSSSAHWIPGVRSPASRVVRNNWDVAIDGKWPPAGGGESLEFHLRNFNCTNGLGGEQGCYEACNMSVYRSGRGQEGRDALRPTQSEHSLKCGEKKLHLDPHPAFLESCKHFHMDPQRSCSPVRLNRSASPSSDPFLTTFEAQLWRTT